MYLNFFSPNFEQSLKEYEINENFNEEQILLEFQQNGIEEVLPIPVNHCKESSGLKITFNNTKIVYSGDCTFSKNLIEESKGSDLLIHESTFDC